MVTLFTCLLAFCVVLMGAYVRLSDAMGYEMNHSASIILFDPQGCYHAYFSPPHDAEKWRSILSPSASKQDESSLQELYE